MIRVLVLLVLATVAVGAPVPAAREPRPSVATVRAAFGKNHVSKELRDIIRALGPNPTLELERVVVGDPAKDDGKDDESYWLTWKTRGLQLAYQHNALRAAFFHNQGADGFDRYPGELPGGMTFADGPVEVARKLGKPEKEEDLEKVREVDGKPQDELWYDYPTTGVRVLFRRIQDKPYTIHSIALHPPKAE